MALQPIAAHAVVLPGTLTVTSPSTGKLAALTAKQVVTLTVSGVGATTLSEATVTGVTLGADPNCAGLLSYVVTSPTTIAVKTPDTGCAASAAPEDVSLLFGNDAIIKTGGVTFVTSPAIAAVDMKPVITNNSTALPPAQQVQNFVTNGGQTVQVYAGAQFAFDPRASAGLSAAMSGKAGTAVKVYDPAGAVIPPTVTTAPVVANSMSFVTASGMSVGNTTITITQSGVTKTFTAAETGITLTAAPIVTSLTITSGKAAAPTTTVINGLNFDKVPTNYDPDAANPFHVTFCGVDATAFGTPAVNATGTQITVKTPDVTAKSPGLGETTYFGPCGVRVGADPGNPATMSPVTPTSIFIFLNE